MKKAILFSLATVIFLTGCGSTNTTSKNIKNINQNTNDQFLMGGKISTNEQANITSKISAKVSEISVDLGSKTNEGDVLIKLDTKDLQGQVDQAQAALNTANANLTNAQNITRPEQIAEAQSSVSSASQSYETVKKNYDRVQALVNAGAATQQELDSANQQLATADSQYKTAQEQLAMLENGPTKSSIDVYKAQVDQAQAALKTAQTALSNAIITAPISGVVNTRNVNVGDTVSPGATLLSIINSSNLYVNAYAPLDIVSQIKEGQEVAVKVSEIPDKQFKGRIAVINSNLNSESRDILVKVSLTDKDSQLKPGMFAEIGLEK
ncbi:MULTISPECIES: HlyD family secretion protein [Clostridium]|jgi:HlyD family secretion protein|uniref:Multidrug resistance protein EmrK n=3 Tax=Clostridium TaxID=1485 RepID=D8GMB1_CLOLD|nr:MULTISPECIES: efflux RND transporter periplasmic adaptor subunit [Clostridium]ADK13521.1 secretion protein HlyD family protein [Clostridium ljungdahlii DSM 13528]AGY76716.1 efflux RND transporter periplasmic adaptor subunit [Clostridium autoethanogenum DSM 10061]ALU36871.1 Efflux transporter RND family MFP subunit [Clostridium autoethanogenum DSM 10061]OAA89139.1 putative multidrug resistance protein EmrK [Clostridium ljungdahlii DSM 13528]OAA94211.1 putative multidrug resistance protein Em